MTNRQRTAGREARFEGAAGAGYVRRLNLAAGHDRASTGELCALGLYFVLILALADVLNVRPGIEYMTGAVVIAALTISRQPGQFFRDWWFFVLGLILWNVSGAIAAGSPFPSHLDFLLHLDNWLFFGHIPAVSVQHALAQPGHVGPLDVFSVVIYNMHLPEPFVAGYFLWRINRAVYFQFAAAVLLLLVLGFVTFILFPAVPPWMAWTTFHRIPHVVNLFGPILHAHPLPFHGTPLFYFFHWRGDRIAAFPSEHAALPMLELLAFFRVAGKALSILLLLWVACVLFSILYLGEHWVTDALAGWAFALIIFWGVRRFSLAGTGD